MEADRYPKSMLETLKALDDTSSRTRVKTWTAELKSILSRVNHEHFVRLNDADVMTVAIPGFVDALKLSSFIEDQRRACFSSFCLLYRGIEDLSCLSREPHLNLGLSWVYLRLYTNCRLAGNLFLSFHINGVLYKIDARENCSVCNMNTHENLYHIMIGCPVYNNLREK